MSQRAFLLMTVVFGFSMALAESAPLDTVESVDLDRYQGKWFEIASYPAWFQRDRILFNRKPGEKAEFIRMLQEKGHTVLMTGDGLNDAGALMQSDVALTLASRVYHFSPASDAVLEADQFPKLARFIRYTRTSLKVVKLSFLISFLYNIVGISFAITGNLSPIVAAILMPVSSVSVVAFATFMTRATGRFKGP